jgi:hypothetical protein
MATQRQIQATRANARQTTSPGRHPGAGAGRAHRHGYVATAPRPGLRNRLPRPVGQRRLQLHASPIQALPAPATTPPAGGSSKSTSTSTSSSPHRPSAPLPIFLDNPPHAVGWFGGVPGTGGETPSTGGSSDLALFHRLCFHPCNQKDANIGFAIFSQDTAAGCTMGPSRAPVEFSCRPSATPVCCFTNSRAARQACASPLLPTVEVNARVQG